MEDPSRESAAPSSAEHSQKGGLLHSLRDLLATLIATGRTRLELLQVELEEERLRLVGIAVLAVAAIFLLGLAVLLFTFFVILLFWDTHRVMATGIIAVFYLGAGLCCAVAARRRANTKTKLFAASLAQLETDRERLAQAD